MDSNPKFDYGMTVRVANSVPTLGGNLGSIVGYRFANSSYLYTVEFGNGNDAEIDESLLSLVE